MIIDNTVSERKEYYLQDLIEISKQKFGYLSTGNEVDSNYGDINHDKINYFDLNLGCGKCGDIVQAKLVKRSGFNNVFSIYDRYDRGKIGELKVLEDNHLRIWIDKCDEYEECCCGSFIEQDLITESTTTNPLQNEPLWDSFYSNFKKAVNSKDAELLKSLTSKEFYIPGGGIDFKFYFSSENQIIWTEYQSAINSKLIYNKAHDNKTLRYVGVEGSTLVLIFEDSNGEWNFTGILGD